MPLDLGTRLGPYEILALLGAGGMGEVYRARDTRLQRTVAIKVLPPARAASPEVRRRFEREARSISQLSHPHICALYDVGREGEIDYLVMEYLEGETLADRLTKGPPPVDQALRIGIQIADALDRAHRHGIVHRDLKPGNVMLTKSGVKLLDFGLAKEMAPPALPAGLTAFPTQANLTQEGAIVGTIQYMAPEQLEGKDADARTDIFAFGGTFYELATGQKAFAGASHASLITAIMSGEPAPISSLQPMAPAGLDRLVKKCLAKDPSDRWASARDLADELKWLSEAPAPAGQVAAARSDRPGGRRTETIAWSLAAVLGLALLGLGYSMVRRPDRPARVVRLEVPAPEVTIASDLFALGLVLYELFTGRKAYPGTSGEEIARLQTESIPTTPSDHVDGLDPVVDRVILRCLAINPAERPPSALAVAAALPGGDPLAAALLAGETPSPEMVAAAGVAETLQPGRAISLAIAAVVLFIGGISLMGRYGLHAYLPLDKPPEALTDRAREIVGQLGYTEPVYADPADTAIGYSFWSAAYDRLRDEGSAERLRDPEAGVLNFWYRQSPQWLKPATGEEVTRWDPFPRTTGEILVSLRMDGRLETFVASPRRYREASATKAESAEYDWSLPFQLAGLDMTDFERTEPRYQRFMQTDQRAAWAPRDPATPFRIEAGANEGRLSLFLTLDQEEAERLAAEPRVHF